MRGSDILSSLMRTHGEGEEPALQGQPSIDEPAEKSAPRKLIAVLVLPLALGMAVIMFFVTAIVALRRIAGRLTGRS